MTEQNTWYIVKTSSGHCTIVPGRDIPEDDDKQSTADDTQRWGPFSSEGEAIARRVGLIRSGKCQPQ